jgi:hypothetical protein
MWLKRMAATTFAVLMAGTNATPAGAQGASTWFLAEGANNAIFTQEILVGNPSANTLDVTVTLLPQPDAIAPVTTRTFTLAPTSRLTVRLGPDFQLNGSNSTRVSAVLAGTSTPADIVVERTMYFPDATRPGAHNAGGVTQGAPAWTLAEGATTIFDTFVLVANPNPTETLVRATYLTATGQQYVSQQLATANGRATFWPRQEHPGLQAAEFSTFVESLTTGNDVVAERAMYFDGLRSGHDALGVAMPSTTWYFAEGFTGGNAQTAFETFLLLANTGTTDGTATVDYLLDTGQVVTLTYPVAARSRFTVWVDQEGREVDSRLTSAAFGIRVTATVPIVAERAMYWGTPSAGDPNTPMMPWVEGHATAGATTPSPRWGFAEGQQGVFGAAATRYDSFFLIANVNPAPIAVRATFAREDGLGIVREVCVPANARANIWTADFSELSGHRFATFVESVPSATCGSVGNEPFVAERALYLGPAFQAGHVNMGTPWTGTIVAPPPAPAFGLANVTPSAGRLGGGQTVTLTGAGFQPGARVYFLNPEWTADRNANTVLPDVDEATNVVVSGDGTSITARTPARSFSSGYQTAGPVTVRVVNPGNATTELPQGFTFQLNVLAFGDDFVFGALDGGGQVPRPFPQQLRTLLTTYQRPLLDPATGALTGGSRLQFGTYVQVANGGVIGECASSTTAPCTNAGSQRFPSLVDAVRSTNPANAFDAVVFLEGINDVRAGISPVSVRFAMRGMLLDAASRQIVPIVTRLDDGTNLISSGDLGALNTQLWELTEEPLGMEVYRQQLFTIPSGGAYPTQAGYDRMAQLIFEKVAREFPLQPCDARADKPGQGCPRNP